MIFTFILLQCNNGNESKVSKVRISGIVVASENEAKEIIDKLNNNEDFTTLAKEYSIGPNSLSGGDLGFIAYEDMGKELSNAIKDKSVGEYSDYIFYNNQYYILLKTDEKSEVIKSNKSNIMQQPDPLLSFLPFLLISILFAILNFIIAPQKGKNRIVYLLLSLIPMLGTLLSIYLISLTDIKLLDKIEKIEQLVEKALKKDN